MQYLLSDGYGVNASVAKGVGIEISRQNGEPLKLLGSELIVGGGRAAGWYPVLEDSTSNGTANGVTNYSKQLSATLKALPNKTPTAGRVAATAQVIIKVQ
ncbi:hypothetical protein CK910_22800 [Aeromonas sp. CA23]|uniref:fimbrial protein n=1 Tax=Aeromonas sp. CA23 TaxID=2033032 RepID=UPI000BFBF982|nr:fimbrial protein [Aeromonas sp. CA23]ATM00992.1 hypothetical protein CK910_22800 [Aeromonas sp. CA23]